MQFDRRTLFGATAAAWAASAFTGTRNAEAKIPNNKDVELRGTTGILERLPRLDLEASEEFMTTFRIWLNGRMSRAAEDSGKRTLAAKGFDAATEGVSHQQAIELLKDDPQLAAHQHMWHNMQRMSWRNLQKEFHDNYEAYMAEMEAADKAGPGTLELNPDLVYPEYTKHEIHMQPGGFVGDPFAGHMYHYLTNNFQENRNSQDEGHRRRAANVPLPADRRVRRVLDIGCGIGRMTLALKQRFPEAEVWGIDVGAPLVRYGHMRAVDLGIEVHFAHRLAEDTKFPDRHFDVVASNILHHEVSAEASAKIVEEIHRILRPGGLYFPIDFFTGTGRKPVTTPIARFRNWVTHRWNHERWTLEYETVDMPAIMKKAGFEVNLKGPRGYDGDDGNIVATRVA